MKLCLGIPLYVFSCISLSLGIAITVISITEPNRSNGSVFKVMLKMTLTNQDLMIYCIKSLPGHDYRHIYLNFKGKIEFEIFVFTLIIKKIINPVPNNFFTRGFREPTTFFALFTHATS